MKIETISEQRERLLRENANRKVPGRTLPRGRQWTGLDQPGCGAARRRLRQAHDREREALDREFRRAMQAKSDAPGSSRNDELELGKG